MISRCSSLCVVLLVLRVSAQQASPPGEPMVQGIPPDERVDVTGDGIPDLVITGRVDNTPDPEQGLHGWYRRGVKTLPGSSILLSVAHQAKYFTLVEGERMDTAALAKGFHFEQLMWTPASEVIEFRLLEQAFGPGITPAAQGWYGTGEYYDGTMVLRSHVGGRTSIAAFNVWFQLPSGHIGITMKEALTVEPDFGKEGDPAPAKPKVPDAYSFGHELEEQVIIPPGIPPDARIDVVGDEAPDVVLTGHEEHMNGTEGPGYYVRGVSPLPGLGFLMAREATDRPWEFFHLSFGARITPDSLALGLRNSTLMWASAERESVFCPVLRHPIAMDDQPQEWSLVDEEWKGDLVYRTSYYGHTTVIGVLEVQATVPGGELRLQPQNWVEEGQVLEVR